MQYSEIPVLLVGIGAGMWFQFFPPRGAPMRLILGLIAIAFLTYGISAIVLEGGYMKIPFWTAVILGGLVGGIAAGWAWNQSIKPLQSEQRK